jgi:ArsR family transcriptional regulator
MPPASAARTPLPPTRSARQRLERTRILKAMAHPSRLLMLEALSAGELCVCDLRDLVGSDLSTVSKHLALMRDAGLVVTRKEGLQVFYTLRVPCILKFFDCVDAVRAASR